MAGGAIGDILTGAIMSVYVLHWARILKQKLETLGITPLLLKIYIDDQNFIIKSLPPGSRIVGDRIVIDQIWPYIIWLKRWYKTINVSMFID